MVRATPWARLRPVYWACVFGVWAGVGAAMSVQAQSAEDQFEIEDYFRVQRVTELAMSSDARWLAYVVETRAPDDASVRRVHLRSLIDDDDRVVTELEAAAALTWIAGTRQVAFLREREGSTQVLAYDVQSKLTRALTRSAHPVTSFAFSPDGKRFAYTTREPSPRSKSLYQRFREDEQGILVDAQITSSHDFLNPDWHGLVKLAPLRLWITSGGGVSTVPLPGEVADTDASYQWSSDGRLLSIAYLASDLPAGQLRSERTSVGVFDTKTQRFRSVATAIPPQGRLRGTYYAGGEWIPGTRKMLLRRVSETDPWVSGSFPDWTIVDVQSPASAQDLIWRPIEVYPRGLRFVPVSPERIMLANTANGVHSLFELSADGVTRSAALAGVEGSSQLFQFDADLTNAVFVNESLTRPPEIYARRRGAPLRQLTRLNEAIANKVQYRSRQLTWTSNDGVTISGWLLEPMSDRGRPRPLLTFVHGGPAFPFPNAFAPYFSMWPFPFELYASRGIAVFIPNYRGTHSYGRAVASGSDRQAMDDIAAGIRSLIASGIADEGRLGISGHSHGAVLGPRVMAREKFFRASSFAEGVASSVVMYELMSGEANREIHDAIVGASLYEAPLRYIEESPDLQFAGLQTACLFEAGAYTGALLMLGFPKAAAHAGMPSQFVVYPNTAHNLAVPRLMRESARRNLDWFESWLLERKAPRP